VLSEFPAREIRSTPPSSRPPATPVELAGDADERYSGRRRQGVGEFLLMFDGGQFLPLGGGIADAPVLGVPAPDGPIAWPIAGSSSRAG